jgi:hypothetical protein
VRGNAAVGTVDDTTNSRRSQGSLLYRGTGSRACPVPPKGGPTAAAAGCGLEGGVGDRQGKVFVGVQTGHRRSPLCADDAVEGLLRQRRLKGVADLRIRQTEAPPSSDEIGEHIGASLLQHDGFVEP